MTPNKLITAALLALTSMAGSSMYDGIPQTSTAPCAPVPKLKEPRVSPPSGLRIIRSAFLRLSDFEAEPVSHGPSVAPGADGAALNPGPHDYFDMLSLRSECMVAYSLRDAQQLFDYAQSTAKPQDVTYDPLNDPDPRRQDAAKLLIPANQVSLGNNVMLPIPSVDTGSLLVTWDSWLGREFAYATTGIGNYKHFQLASPASRIWTEVKSDFDYATKFPPAVAMIRIRYYGEIKNGEAGPNVTNENPLSPQASEFAIMPEIWTRYWAYFKPAGQWFEFSLWVADETRGPVLVIDRRQINPNYGAGATGWEKFWLEYNTSAHGLDAGFPARVAYARNVVMMRSVADPTALLARPVR
jgi:hypothetical protein